jgi:hypothetical protein
MEYVSPFLLESRTARSRAPIKLNDDGTDTTNWSGVVVEASPDRPIGKSIVGHWNVATATNVDSTGDQYSQWIGTGAWSRDPDDNLLQAGVTGHLGGGAFNLPPYYAWWEWTSTNRPSGSVAIPNFPIHPGDYFEVNIWILSDTTANISFFAGDPIQYMLIEVNNSGNGFRIQGRSAEWIVERPTLDDGVATLANYGHAVFVDALAWVDYGVTLFPGSGLPITMYDEARVELSRGHSGPSAQSTTVTCDYVSR